MARGGATGQRIGRLAAEVTSFVDRRREIAEVKRLLATARLVTLTGVGGTGKTRLALRLAGELRRAFPDGVWQVDLAGLRDGSLLEYAVAEVLGIRGASDPPARMLGGYLAERDLLLVLDNCEHPTMPGRSPPPGTRSLSPGSSTTRSCWPVPPRTLACAC